jgi:Chaperone for flagella basal body P-ring formation
VRVLFDRTGLVRSHLGSSRWKLLLAAGLVLSAPWAASQGVALPETAEVSGGTIRLSDLLPPTAPLALRQASAAIELGRSPQPGSVRVLEAAQIAQALTKQPGLLRQLTIPDRIVIRRLGWTVQREAIREAIRRFLGDRSDHRELPERALQSPGDITAREENPALEVAGIVRDVRGRGLECRFRCVQRALCPSFVARLLDPEPLSLDRSEVHSSTSSLTSWLPSPVAAKEAGPILAEAGKKAMLLLDDGKMSISLQVVCLERGRLLQNIRVLDASSHRVLQAEVVGPGKLHGSL